MPFQNHYGWIETLKITFILLIILRFKTTTVGLRPELEYIMHTASASFKTTTVGLRQKLHYIKCRHPNGFKTTTVGLRPDMRITYTKRMRGFKTTTVGLRHSEERGRVRVGKVSKPLRLD